MDKTQQHLEQAYSLEANADLNSALQECEAAIQLDPTLAEAHNLRGIILEELGQSEQAIAAYGEAARLDPKFEEAQQNLLEAQQDVLEQQALTWGQVFKIAGWSAAAFAASFAIADAAIATLRCGLILSAVLFALAAGAGAAGLWLAARPNCKLGVFAGLGALGWGTAFILTYPFEDLYYYFHFRNLSFDTAFLVAAIVRYGIIGVCVGAALGVAQKSWRQIGALALAGAFGFGSYGLCNEVIFRIFLSLGPLYDFLVTDSIKLISIVLAIIRFLIVGGIGGALLGLAITWPDWPIIRARAKAYRYECSVCGEVVGEEATVCPRCGDDLSQVEETIYECSECGATVGEEANTCPRCGADLSQIGQD